MIRTFIHRGRVGPTHYVARTPSRETLRFSKSGNRTIETPYRHWILGKLSGKERERLADKASRAPELVVIQPLNDTWKCHRCGGTGDLEPHAATEARRALDEHKRE